MERFEEYLVVDPIGSPGIAVDEAGEPLEAELSEHTEHAEHAEQEEVRDSASTDDPVRVYLREMGAVRLLSRQGEIDLAPRIERGNLLMHKALSRSPLAWRRALAWHEDVRRDNSLADALIEFTS